jgi:hypothetical protein
VEQHDDVPQLERQQQPAGAKFADFPQPSSNDKQSLICQASLWTHSKDNVEGKTALSQELYDHRNDTAIADFDATENVNVVSDPRNAAVLQELTNAVHKFFAEGCPS